MQQLQNPDVKYITIPFIKDGKALDAKSAFHPVCGLTVKAGGSMRFRWAEKNPLRDELLGQIARDFGNKTFVPVQLDHTRLVYEVNDAFDTDQKIGDGIITRNKNLIPTVTVADCLPVYFYDFVTQAFGIVHSGWKGTGIIGDAIRKSCEKYNSSPENFCVVIGPHIHDCCYIVNEERADYFAKNFTPECVRPLEKGIEVDWNSGGGKLFRLSLEKANLFLLEKIGVKAENIYSSPDCTSCSKNGFYGSNRRETKLAGCPDAFTVQAAFIVWK